MFNRAMVVWFLGAQGASQKAINEAEARMAEFAGKDGNFPAAGLTEALNDEVLEKAFLDAWNMDSTPFLDVVGRSSEPPSSDEINAMCET